MGISKMMSGSSMLSGNNTIPGVQVPPEVQAQIPTIFKACDDFGLTYYPTVVEFLRYDDISEVAAYGGFPVRFPHWQFGMEYAELAKGYEHGAHRIYEMVVNTNPCYIYCLDSNTLVDNVTVIAHALFHNDFFKNNVYFSATNTGMMNKMANHGTRIRQYIARWGKERVTEFIDHVLRIDTLVDSMKAWDKKEFHDRTIADQRNYRYPNRIDVPSGRNYMEPWLNSTQSKDKEWKRVHDEEAAEEIGAFGKPTKDIFGFIKDNAPLTAWQQDIMSMLYEESMYFAPQRMTKMLNEGWASFGDHTTMCRMGLVSLGQDSHDDGIFEYAKHKMGVLGGKYSMNPYKLGFMLFLDIEERWNKGRFGDEWENCKDAKIKENWDTQTNLGKEKVFEVRKCYNDLTAIMEFFTDEFCEKNEFFEYKTYPNGEIKIENRDPKTIRQRLIKRYSNGGLPDIKLADHNHLGQGWLCLEHNWDGRPLYDPYVRHTMASLYYFWQKPIVLATQTQDGQEFVYVCDSVNHKEVTAIARKEYEAKVGNMKFREKVK